MYDRFLTRLGPEAKTYEISQGGHPVAEFTTDGVNGKSADDTAIGNLLDFSEYHIGEYELHTGTIFLATADGGIGRRA